MKKVRVLATMALLAGAVATIMGADNQKTLVVTSSNTPSNELLVYDTGGVLVQIAPTLGQGGVGGNAGGIAKQNGTVAVVNDVAARTRPQPRSTMPGTTAWTRLTVVHRCWSTIIRTWS